MQAFEQYMSESGDRVKMSPICPICINLSLPKVNLTKPRKLLNPELSNET